MKIIDIYGRDNGIVLIENSSKLNGIEVENVRKKFTGDRAQRYIENLSKLELKKVRDNGIDAKLYYENIYLVNLYDYKKINLKDIRPILISLKRSGISLKNKKIRLQRSNRYAGGVVVALMLATSVVLSTPLIINQVVKKKDLTDVEDIQIVYENPEDIDYTVEGEEESTSTLYLSGIDYIKDDHKNEKNDLPKSNYVEADTMEVETDTTEVESELSQSDISFVPLDSGNAIKDAVYKYLKTETDFNNAAIAAIMGNIQQECSYDISSTYLESNGYTSHGLCQWNGERYSNLKKYCGDNIKSVEAQLAFMMKELKNGYKTAYNYLINAENTSDGAREAALCFAIYYEVCDSSSYGARQSYAENYYDAIESLKNTSSAKLNR